ncbi:hypothetical protein ABW20_dc0103151 [Dactylellina cionopaga]|nr:hypothetical protein ABW20_dc0103151 [Dactylellina cionopaga]
MPVYLQAAIAHNKPYAAKAMIEEGKVPIQSPTFKEQPIQIAARCMNLPVVVALLEAGAEPDGTGIASLTTALQTAAAFRSYHLCTYLLQHGANPLFHKGFNNTALEVGLFDDTMEFSESHETHIRNMLSGLVSREDFDTVMRYLKRLINKASSPPSSSAKPLEAANEQAGIKILSKYKEDWTKRFGSSHPVQSGEPSKGN